LCAGKVFYWNFVMRSHPIIAASYILILSLATGCAPAVINAPTQMPQATLIQPSPIPTDTVAPTRAPTSLPESTAALPVLITMDNAAGLQSGINLPIANPYRVVWTLGGPSLAVLAEGGVTLFDSQKWQTITAYALPANNMLLDFSPDGHTVAISPDQQQADLIDITSEQTVQTLKPSGQLTYGNFSPDGKTFGIASGDEIAVSLWDVATDELKKNMSGFETAAPTYHFIFSPDGQYIVWIARAHAQVMNIASQQMGPALGHEDFINDLAFTPDGKVLAVGTAGTVNQDIVPIIKLWDPHSGLALETLTPGNNVSSLAFSPDGKLLAVGAANTLMIWNWAEQKQLFTTTIDSQDDRISGVSFSPDGRTLVTLSTGGSMRIWQVRQ
jgi:hypothetical protein